MLVHSTVSILHRLQNYGIEYGIECLPACLDLLEITFLRGTLCLLCRNIVHYHFTVYFGIVFPELVIRWRYST